MDNILIPAIKSVVIYVLLIFLTRIAGRKSISQMTFFDFALVITIGSVAATTALGSYNDNLISGMTVLIVLASLDIIIGLIQTRSFRFSKLVDSEPIVVIDRGTIVDQNLRRERLTLKELTALLREKNIFNIADVEYALLETNGRLSVLPKSNKQPLRPEDMDITTPYQGLTHDVIVDGNLMRENLKQAQLTEQWLSDQLRQHGISTINDVFYAGVDSSKNVYISKKSNAPEHHGQYGVE